MKVVSIVGARPQFVKAAVVSRAFAHTAADVQELLVHTGQHYDKNMSDVFFYDLEIPRPRYHLGIGGGTHGQNTGRMIEKLEEVLMAERPDWVLVYGDTDSTLAGALAAVKLHVKVAHVEGGLRSFNRRMPEEINRVMVDHASDLLFTPTDVASQNLSREGISREKCLQVGDVMYDATLYYGARAEQTSRILEQLALQRGEYVLATIHRQENTDERARLSSILVGFASSIAQVVWPVHPRTRKRLHEFGIDVPSNVRLIDPVGYFDMLMLEKNAGLIVTDSGGVQKEAYFHGVPCLILREETEWVELVEAGASRLVGADATTIAQAIATTGSMTAKKTWLYGRGDAGTLIGRAIQDRQSR